MGEKHMHQILGLGRLDFCRGLTKNGIARTNNENLEEYLCASVPL